ncbi:MAG: DMT family transporter [Clostridia bacterium]|nr:DMT family transporter [Clostridia bacterium]
MNKRTGLLFAMGAAIFYGISTITAKMSYVGGGNAITISFYRNFISIPMIFVILKYAKISLRVTKREVVGLIVLGVLGGFITGALLYTAYANVSVGLTTCMHFSYPVILAFVYVLIFKDKLSRTKVISLVLGFGGIWFFLENDAVANTYGLFAAFMSGVSYAAYLLFMDKWNLKTMNGLKLSFYCCIFSSVSLYVYGLMKGYSFQGVMSSGAWIWINSTAVLVSVLGSSMVPVAVKYVGSTVTAIVGILEPVTSVLLGVLFLAEPFGLRSAVGAILVLAAAVLLGLEEEPKKRLKTKEKERSL